MNRTDPMDAVFDVVMSAKGMPNYESPEYERWLFDASIFAFRTWLADKGLVVVPREPTVGMFRALTLSQMDNDDLKFKLGCWALGSFASDYAAMIAASPDVLGKP